MTRVEKLRLAILISLGTLIAVVAIYSLLYVTNVISGFGYSSDDPYFELDRPLQKDPIEVVEYFSYSCIHCARLDDLIQDWQEDLPEGVQFKMIHVGMNTESTLLAKTYVTLQTRNALDQNHRRIYTHIHDRGRTFLNVDDIADFVDGYGLSKQLFLSTFNSSRINKLHADNVARVRDLQVLNTPTIIVANKYLVVTGLGRKKALDTVDWLIQEILAGREPVKSEQPSEESAEEVAS